MKNVEFLDHPYFPSLVRRGLRGGQFHCCSVSVYTPKTLKFITYYKKLQNIYIKIIMSESALVKLLLILKIKLDYYDK